jgi:hypothetical protein
MVNFFNSLTGEVGWAGPAYFQSPWHTALGLTPRVVMQLSRHKNPNLPNWIYTDDVCHGVR